jgi:hypothetical protein
VGVELATYMWSCFALKTNQSAFNTEPILQNTKLSDHQPILLLRNLDIDDRNAYRRRPNTYVAEVNSSQRKDTRLPVD